MMNIVVLAGGTSSEREISIVSGEGVCAALRERGHRAILLDVFSGEPRADLADPFPEQYDTDAAAAAIRAVSEQVMADAKVRRNFFGPDVIAVCERADAVFLALHGANGEDGRLQGGFDLFGIPYTGTGYLSSALAMDKTMTKHIFRAHGIPMPEGFSVMKWEEAPAPETFGMPYPVIVKPCCGGSSLGVTVAQDADSYRKALETSFALEDEAVVERFISGREFAVAVIDNEAYPIIEVTPKGGFYDYEHKYKAGMTIETCPADLPDDVAQDIQRVAVEASQALGITGYVRMDFILEESGKFYVLEANTLPGMTPTSLIPQEAAAIGISYGELCEKLIACSIDKSADGRADVREASGRS